VAGRGSGAALGSLLAGVGSTAALPVAVYTTRFSDSYDLLHAALAIPIAAGLGLVALGLSRRARLRATVSLSDEGSRYGAATAGRVLGLVGLCLAASALVALAVFGLLEYVGSRE
jgi:ABC-type Fe3+ transport system permease subunit